MKWKDIRVEMMDSAPLISRLRFTITFEYEKGYKIRKTHGKGCAGKTGLSSPLSVTLAPTLEIAIGPALDAVNSGLISLDSLDGINQ